MGFRLLSDFIVIIHLAFIIFVAAGALLVMKWNRLAFIHIPAVIWGAIVEYTGWICPLTPWENHFRRLAGDSAYQGDFTGNYILPVIYPGELTRNIQIILGSIVIIINMIIYGIIIYRSVKVKDS